MSHVPSREPERQDPGRREFLLRLAKASVFVPPVIASLRAAPLQGRQGQGQGPGGGKGGGQLAGGLTPTEEEAASIQGDGFDLQSGDQRAPWEQGRPTAPWARPPGGDR